VGNENKNNVEDETKNNANEEVTIRRVAVARFTGVCIALLRHVSTLTGHHHTFVSKI
jgi:hypothetical protein